MLLYHHFNQHIEGNLLQVWICDDTDFLMQSGPGTNFVCVRFFLPFLPGRVQYLAQQGPSRGIVFSMGGAFEVPVDTTVEGAQPCPQPDSLQTHALLCFVFFKKGSVKARWEILK